MEEVVYILFQSLKEDPISRAFTQVIVILLFIGALPNLIGLSSYFHKKFPVLAKSPKNPFLFVGLCLLGAGIGFGLSSLSWFFSLLFFILFFISISPRFKKLSFVSIQPSLLTTIGILGTFVGIYIGLDKFNILNIDASIPELLRGLKIAFTTSIAGIVSAIILKIVQSHSPNQNEEKDIFETFNKIQQSLEKLLEQSKSQHEQILKTTKENIELQDKIMDYVQSKTSSLETPAQKSPDSFKSPDEIKNNNT